MLIPCLRAEAVFPAQGIRLAQGGPRQAFWDEHGGTFVIRLDGLEVAETATSPGEAAIILELALEPRDALAAGIREFAGPHNLPLALAGPASAEFQGEPVLAAGHLPGKNLFVFCETPQITARLAAPDTVELTVSGRFQARKVPSQETDLIIHLLPGDMARLLSFLLRAAEAG